MAFVDIDSLPIVPHEGLKWVDASKLTCYCLCERLYFFQYVVGLRRIAANPTVDLIFGSAMHFVHETLAIPSSGELFGDVHVLNRMQELVDSGETSDSAAVLLMQELSATGLSKLPDAYNKACAMMEAEVDEWFVKKDDGFDLEWSWPEYKSPARLALLLLCYYWEYRYDYAQYAPHPLVTSSMEIFVEHTMLLDGNEVSLVGKFDKLVIDTFTNLAIIREHKSGTVFPNWAEKWKYSIQAQLYALFLRKAKEETKFGEVIVEMDGALINKKLKPVQANDQKNPFRYIELVRHKVRQSRESEQVFLANLRARLRRYRNDFRQLAMTSTTTRFMDSFPQNTDKCLQMYGKPCPFLNICHADPNPLKVLERLDASQFEIFHWNPKDELKSHEPTILQIKDNDGFE